MATYEKTHTPRTLSFDNGSSEGFDTVATVGAGVANTVIQSTFPLPQRAKIFKVVATFATGTGALAFNIVAGTVAETGVGLTDTVALPGTTVFAGDQVVTNAALVPQVFAPANYDVIYETGQLLTLRLTTVATTGAATNVKVLVFLKYIDAGPSFTGIVPGSLTSF